MTKVMITGGCGFIGSNFIHHLLKTDTQVHIFNFDKLTYAGNPENLQDLEKNPRYHFEMGDIADRNQVNQMMSSRCRCCHPFCSRITRGS